MATTRTTAKKLNTRARDNNFIPWPRRLVYRRFFRFFLRTLSLLFVDAKVSGRQHFPEPGKEPVILVANHIAFLEIAMMMAYAPYPIEFLTSGDIPLEPKFEIWTRPYGYIPVKRGQMDRKAMAGAVSVLEQGGVIGLFPQGGIWTTDVTQARTGVAWLSQKGQATVVPIGFGGTEGAFTRALRLQRPTITMNVGEPIPPAPEKDGEKSRKEILEDYTSTVMHAVFDLIPQEEKDRWHRIEDEQFSLELQMQSGSRSANGSTPTIERAESLSKFFHRPVLLDAFRRNLELPVGALQRLETEHNPEALASAVDAILAYIEHDNPYFLTYRFGNEEGHEIEAALRELRDAANWAAQHGYDLHVKPIRKYRIRGETDYRIQQYPEAVHDL